MKFGLFVERHVSRLTSDILMANEGSAPMVLHLVRMEVSAGKRKEVWQTIRSLAAELKKEMGCVDSGFYQNTEDENDFLS